MCWFFPMILCNIYSYGFSVSCRPVFIFYIFCIYVGLWCNIMSNPIFVFNAEIFSLPACRPTLKFSFYPQFPVSVYVNSICIIQSYLHEYMWLLKFQAICAGECCTLGFSIWLSIYYWMNCKLNTLYWFLAATLSWEMCFHQFYICLRL